MKSFIAFIQCTHDQLKKMRLMFVSPSDKDELGYYQAHEKHLLIEKQEQQLRKMADEIRKYETIDRAVDCKSFYTRNGSYNHIR